MGSAIARRVVEQGGDLVVWNRSESAMVDAKESGIQTAKTLLELFESVDVVISVFSNDAAVLEAFSPEFLGGISNKPIHINMATISLEAAKELQERHELAGVEYLGAPVLGRPVVASAGKLLCVVGGKSETLASAAPVLDLFTAKIFHMGTEAWVSAVVKLGVNYNLIHAMQALAESLAMVEAAGVEGSKFVEILTTAAFTGSAYQGYGPMIAGQHYSPPGFNMSMGLKDMGLIESASKDLGLALPMAPILKRIYERALQDPELVDYDWSAMAEVTKRQLDL